MYAIKQAMLLSGSLPLADITIYYMDIRAFGKGYEEFYRSAQAMGIEFVKGKVARLSENDDQSVTVRVERIDQFGQVEERRHDLVVLSLGLRPGADLTALLSLEAGTDGFVQVPHSQDAPCRTSIEGVFVAGTASGPKDIVDTIVEAGAAATEASLYLRASRRERKPWPRRAKENRAEGADETKSAAGVIAVMAETARSAHRRLHLPVRRQHLRRRRRGARGGADRSAAERRRRAHQHLHVLGPRSEPHRSRTSRTRGSTASWWQPARPSCTRPPSGACSTGPASTPTSMSTPTSASK